MAVDDIVRVFLASYFAIAAVFYTAKLIGVRQRTGIVHGDAGSRGTTQFVAHTVFKVFRLIILGVCVTRVIWPGMDQLLIPFEVLDVPAVKLAGAALMCVAFGGIAYVHTYMGAEWRSGVGDTVGHELLTGGPYAYTRNPMFVAIILSQVGFFLAMPTLFTLLCLAVGVSAVLAQETYEEAKLTRQFGKAYEEYRRLTPRWWPRSPRAGTTSGMSSVG
jgi:protein-S-isoprenylcysteine O-methyltransferase Ste14